MMYYTNLDKMTTCMDMYNIKRILQMKFNRRRKISITTFPPTFFLKTN